MENILNFKYPKGSMEVYPDHKMVRNWLFRENELEEAELAHHLAKVAEKNGISTNELANIFPMVLRMLKSKSEWAE